MIGSGLVLGSIGSIFAVALLMWKSRGALRAVLKAATKEEAPKFGAGCHFAFLVR